ncbi:MAG TPA: FtsX-like permease family protein, partial [Longimicrobiales bacterium]|nr:FtsX-like permease family protein [Longimicrobiales bacterium]
FFDAFDLALDWRVLAATTALCFVCALLFGITPMGQTLRVDVKSGLTGQGVVSERGGVRGRLIALQVGLSCLLVIIGLHASRGVLSRLAAAPGVELDGLIVARLDLDTRALDSIARRHYLEHAITTMRALPGVRHTGLSSELPTVSRSFGAAPVSTPAGPVTAGTEWVDTDYFQTLGIPLLTGSLPGAALTDGEERSIVVNRAFAERLGGPAVGTRLQRFSYEYQVVGVVDDDGGATGDAAVPMLYHLTSGLARGGGPVHLVARVEPGFEGAVMAQFVPPIRDRYPQLVPPEVGTLRAQVREMFAPLRYISNAALAIGAMQLLLATLGLYSLLLYATLARTREIGLRMALGARPRRASLTVMKGGLYYVLGGAALGVALGVPGAIFAANSFMGGDAADPVPFAAALLAIALSTLAAAYIPARRAARVQPMAALRTE